MSGGKRHLGGVGKGDNSYQKHDLMRKAAGAYIGMNNLSGEAGVVIDMHSGDGEGVALPQPDLFLPSISEPSPRIAARMAAACNPSAVIVLCERRRARRKHLLSLFGTTPNLTILGDNSEILDLPFEEFGWAIILNDPCGHSGHAVEIMQEVSRRMPRSDFIIALNQGGLGRHVGLTAEGAGQSEWRSVRASYETKEQYRWMLSHDEWKNRLGKRHGFITRQQVSNRGWRGRVMIFSNAKAGLSPKVFADA